MKQDGPLFHGKIKDHVKMQICIIFKCSGKELRVNVKASQQQKNSVGCGVYAIVNMFYLIRNADIGRTKI